MIDDWNQAARELAVVLGTDKPVPVAVARRAVFDADFEHKLLVSRSSPKFLDALFRDPENSRYVQHESVPAQRAQPSNGELVGKAAKALFSWARTGFTHVDKETYERRLSACAQCPNLAAAPNSLLYKIKRAGEDMRTCTLCGCVTGRKALIPSESCPSAHPTQAGMTRWGEPIVIAERIGA
jgi:hypothetical protein